MLIGCGFRAAVQAESITDPVAAVLHGYAAPLVAVLVLIHMKEKTKKRSHLVIGESALLIADYFDWVDSLKISR